MDKTDNRFYREAGEPVAWMTPSDWRNEPLATADKSVASAWRADNRQVTPLYASQPKALTDEQRKAIDGSALILENLGYLTSAEGLRSILFLTETAK